MFRGFCSVNCSLQIAPTGTIELTVGDVNIKRTDIPRNIASGKGPAPIIRMMFEQQLELVAAWKPEEQLKAAHISGIVRLIWLTQSNKQMI